MVQCEKSRKRLGVNHRGPSDWVLHCSELFKKQNKKKKNISLLICGNANDPVMFSVVTNEMLTLSLLVLVIMVELFNWAFDAVFNLLMVRKRE